MKSLFNFFVKLFEITFFIASIIIIAIVLLGLLGLIITIENRVAAYASLLPIFLTLCFFAPILIKELYKEFISGYNEDEL